MKRKIVCIQGQFYVSNYVGKGHWLTLGKGCKTRSEAERRISRDNRAESSMKADILNWSGGQ